MAMLQMQRISIYALKKDRKNILEMLQRRGVVEIKDMTGEDSIFHKSDVSVAKTGFEKNIATARDAAEVLNRYVFEKKSMLSSLSGRREVSVEAYDEFGEKHDPTGRIANRILSLSKEIAENNAEILKLEAQIEILTPWIPLDIPMSFSGTRYTKSFIGTLSNTWTLEAVYESLADFMPLNVDIISTSKEQTCIFVLCSRDKADSVYEALRTIDFSHPNIAYDRTPAEQLKYLENQISEAKTSIDNAIEEIKSYSDKKEDLLFLQDYDTMRAEKYEVIGHLLQTQNVFIITGYIPEKDAEVLMNDLNAKFDIAVEIEQPTRKEDVPVLLKNNGFSRPLEGVVGGFSLPGRNEIDPTMVMSLFYYLLFGIMLSDAGYGALMVAACAFALIRFRNTMEVSMKDTLKMYLYCGISTVFWGIMFGSFFGDIIDVVSDTFFTGNIALSPLWFFPVKEPMRMLTFSLLLGLIHLIAGLLMKFYLLLRQRDYKSILYDVISWIVLITSSTILILSMEMFQSILGIDITIPAIVGKIASGLAILSAVIIILTNGRESKNPFKRFLKGLYALYGITSYLSDVLSYSRLLALGLATGVIASVINQMAAMASNVIFGPMFFIIVVIFGHTLNIGINALGAYVHTNRLQYVEFFGKFYEGGGRKFNPFGMNTKYYKVKEKVKNG